MGLIRLNNREHLFRRTDDSVWKFYEHGVTSSMLNTWLNCREQARLTYVEGLSNRNMPMPLVFGTAMHWFLEQAYTWRMNKIKLDLTAFIRNTVALTPKYQKLWRKEVGRPTTAQEQQMELALGMAERIIPHYFARWDGDFLGKRYKYANQSAPPAEWVSLENTFNIPVKLPCGVKIPLRGRRDGVYRDRKKRLWVFDTKCLSVIVDRDILDTLPVNFQFMLYMWVTWKELGEVPAGVVMNVVRRPGQRMTERDTMTTFLDKVRQDVGKPARYDHYYKRFQMNITKGELKAWETNQLIPILEDVKGWWDGTNPHYMNPFAVIGKYGRCGMFEPMISKNYTNTYKRSLAFSELSDV